MQNTEIPNNSTDVPLREDLVTTAVKFLQNPKVMNSPISQKQQFLQRRGLTNPEVQAACERAGAYTQNYDQNNGIQPQLPPVPFIHPHYQVQISFLDRLRDVIHNFAVISIVVYVIHKFYQNYIAPFLFGKKRKSVEDTVNDLESNLKIEMTKLKDSLDEVRTEVDRYNSNTESGTIRQLTELKSDIATVKGLLLTRKQFPSVGGTTPVIPPSIPAWQMSSVSQEGEHEAEEEEHKEELEELGSGSSSEPEHGMKTSESSLEIIYHDDIPLGQN